MPRIAASPLEDRLDDLQQIEELNRQYLRAGETSDVPWYAANLSDDYLCSTVDGKVTDRTAFLERIGRGHQARDFAAVDTQIRFVGELALVHAGFRCTNPDGSAGTGRYTDIYVKRDGRWLCVSAHFNSF